MPAIDLNRAFQIASEVVAGQRMRQEQRSQAAIAFQLEYMTRRLESERKALEETRKETDKIRMQGMFNLMQKKMEIEQDRWEKLSEKPEIDWQQTGYNQQTGYIDGKPVGTRKGGWKEKSEGGTDKDSGFSASEARIFDVMTAGSSSRMKAIGDEIVQVRKDLRAGYRIIPKVNEKGDISYTHKPIFEAEANKDIKSLIDEIETIAQGNVPIMQQFLSEEEQIQYGLKFKGEDEQAYQRWLQEHSQTDIKENRDFFKQYTQ